MDLYSHRDLVIMYFSKYPTSFVNTRLTNFGVHVLGMERKELDPDVEQLLSKGLNFIPTMPPTPKVSAFRSSGGTGSEATVNKASKAQRATALKPMAVARLRVASLLCMSLNLSPAGADTETQPRRKDKPMNAKSLCLGAVVLVALTLPALAGEPTATGRGNSSSDLILQGITTSPPPVLPLSIRR